MTTPRVDLCVVASEELEVLREFKERIPDVLENMSEYKRHDLWLLRWLRARELNISKTEEMLRQSLEWRAREEIDAIFKWNVPDLMHQEFPLKATGFDKDGCVIAVIPFGKWDVRKIVSMGMKSDFIRYVDLLFENVMAFLEHKSTKDSMITQFALIVDYEGFTLRQITCRQTTDCLNEIIRRFETNHPETLKAAWIVNAPKIFEIVFSLMKPLLTARTMSKVHVHGSNSSQWRPLLLENIDADQIPSHYGGSNTSCRDYKVTQGYDVFPVYEVFPEHEFIPVIVAPGAKHVVKFGLEKDYKLSWNFKTADYDIGFSFLYCCSSEDVESAQDFADEVLFECPRADSHLHLQKGSFLTDKSGTYSLVFDNSFSRFRGKSLSYCARSSQISE